jgi:hypothetical protein
MERETRSRRRRAEPEARDRVNADALGAARIAALQRTAGNQAVCRMLQRLATHGQAKWSAADKYVTWGEKRPGELGMADDADRPALAGAAWTPTGKQTTYTPRQGGKVKVPTYTLQWESTAQQVKIPQDCLTTAELVAAWLMTEDPERIGEVKVPPTIMPATATTALGPGDILFHVHSVADEGEEKSGEFHGAALIAADAGDVVTMESDLTSEDAIQSTVPLFDMYAGAGGFHANQVPANADERGNREETYVISFLDAAARSDAEDTLWSGIQKMTFSSEATVAATQIKAAIEAALHSDPMAVETELSY